MKIFELPTRGSVLTDEGGQSFFRRLLALRYCARNPADITSLFVHLHHAQRQKSLLTPLFKRLAQNQGLVHDYAKGLGRSSNVKEPKRNPFYRSTEAKPPIAIFIGVNQSGSWSFREAIDSVLGFDRTLSIEAYSTVTDVKQIPSLDEELQHLRKYIAERKEGNGFIYSHRGIPLHLAVASPNFYATMLRNPISRIVASYYWGLKYRDANFHWIPEIIKRGASIGDYVDFMDDSGWYPGGNRTGEYFFDAWLSQGLIPAELSTDRVAGADYVLSKYFGFVGVTELFEESLFCFAKYINLSRLPQWYLRGSSGRPSLVDIAPRVLRKIDRLTEGDQILYKKYRTRFESEHADEIKYFRRKIGTLRLPDPPELATVF